MSPRGRLYKTEAIVLRTMDLGEADRILTVLTPRLGKLKVVAKGVRRTRSRLGGGLEPLSDVHLVLAIGRTFDVITATALENPHLGLREDLHATASAWYVAELADRFCEERADAHAAFVLLAQALTGLDVPGRHRCARRGGTLVRAPPPRRDGLSSRARALRGMRSHDRARRKRVLPGGGGNPVPIMRPRRARRAADHRRRAQGAAPPPALRAHRGPSSPTGGAGGARGGAAPAHGTISAVLERELRSRDFLEEVEARERREVAGAPAG